MRSNRYMVMAIVACVCVFFGGVTSADEGDCTTYGTDYCFNVTSGDWDVATNWVYSGGGNGVPGATHTVTIPAGRDVTVDTSEACKSFNVAIDGASRGKIYVDKDGTLDLGQILSVSTLDGDLAFITTGGGSADPEWKLSANHEIQGSGTISSPAGTQVSIESDHANVYQYRLTIDGVALEGEYSIDVQFTNDGVVNASRDEGTIVLGTNSDPAGDGNWNVTDPDATLRFNDLSTSLSGDFTIGGTLDVNFNVQTTGDLFLEQYGVIEVSAGKTFKAGL